MPTEISPRLRDGWSRQNLGSLAVKIQDGTHFSPKSTEGPCRYLTSKNVRFGHLDIEDSGWISENEHRAIYARCDVRPGDVLLTKDGANTGNAAINTLEEQFSLLSSVAIIRCDGVNLLGRFVLQYLLSAEGQQRLKDMMSGNAITRLTLEKIKAFQIPVPRPEQQSRIADILDGADAAIRQTEAVIAKLRLMKAGWLHDLLTRGLDERGILRDPVASAEQFKDTTLGRLPRDWSVSNVEREFDIASGFTLGQHRRPSRNPRSYLRVANVQRDAIDLSDLLELEATEAEMADMRLEPGDLLVVEGHADPGQIGRCAIVHGEVVGLTFQNHLFRLRSHRLHAEFANAWLNGGWVRAYWRRQCGTSSGLNTINRTMLKAVQVPIPHPDEQRRLMEAAKAIVDRLRAEESYLAKLNLQKRGLMNDLLTGRVRV